jgi:hypothetical protein
MQPFFDDSNLLHCCEESELRNRFKMGKNTTIISSVVLVGVLFLGAIYFAWKGNIVWTVLSFLTCALLAEALYRDYKLRFRV